MFSVSVPASLTRSVDIVRQARVQELEFLDIAVAAVTAHENGGDAGSRAGLDVQVLLVPIILDGRMRAKFARRGSESSHSVNAHIRGSHSKHQRGPGYEAIPPTSTPLLQ